MDIYFYTGSRLHERVCRASAMKAKASRRHFVVTERERERERSRERERERERRLSGRERFWYRIAQGASQVTRVS